MDSFRFLNGNYLALLWLILPLAALLLNSLKKRGKAVRAFCGGGILGLEGLNSRRTVVKFSVMVIAFAALVLALARPQMGTGEEYIRREGVDIFICMDVSNSMLVEDMRPNRLARAKYEVERFIDLIEGDRIGFVVFAGESFIQCPLTLDYGAARIFQDVWDSDIVSAQGTNIALAIITAIKGFVRSERKHKAIILMSDGESHEGEIESAAAMALEEGVVIYTVGFGTYAGGPVPEKGMRNAVKGYKRERGGNVVISKADHESLKFLARKTGGGYFAAGGGTELTRIYESIGRMEKKVMRTKKFRNFEDRFQYPVAFAIALALGELFIPERRRIGKRL